MRTLKKALSLVLVLAMVFALAVPGFAADTTKKAADFKDYSKVTNKEAVDVLTAIGVINGNADGTFNPEGSFTRAEAATLLTYLILGKTVADALPTGATKFTDVPASFWGAKYIQYCANEGIIAGYGDGKFGPNDTLTSTQWALMLLGALGYNAKNEGIGGTGWEIQVTKLAVSTKIATAEDLTGAFNRDVAAKMAFNTLFADTVSYGNGSTTITTGDGTTIVTGGSKAAKVANDLTDDYRADASKRDKTAQFVEVHYPDFTMYTGTMTATNATSASQDSTVTYASNGSTTGALSLEKLDAGVELLNHSVTVYTNGKTGDKQVVYGIADKATKTVTIVATSDTTAFEALAKKAGFSSVSGKYLTSTSVKAAANYGATANISVATAGKTYVMISNNTNGTVDVIYELSQNADVVKSVNSSTNKTTGVVTTTYAFESGMVLTNVSNAAPRLSTTAELKKGDVVMTTAINSGATYVAEPTTVVTGTYTGYTTVAATSTTTFNVAGTAYSASNVTVPGTVTSVKAPTISNMTAGTDYTLYLDAAGKIVAVKGLTATSSYVYVAKVDTIAKADANGFVSNVLSAVVYDAAGKSAVYALDTTVASGVNAAGLRSMTIGADGKATLALVATGDTAATNVSMTAGVSKMTYDTNKVMYSNADSVVFYVNGTYGASDFSVTTVTGTSKLSTATLSDAAYSTVNGVSVMKAGVVASAYQTNVSSSQVFYNGEYTVTSAKNSDGKTVYTTTYTVYRNGEKDTVSYEKVNTPTTAYTTVGFAITGSANLTSGATNTDTGAVTALYNGTLTVNGHDYQVADAKIVDLTPDTQTFTTLDEIGKDVTIYVQYTTNGTTKTATTIYVTAVAEHSYGINSTGIGTVNGMTATVAANAAYGTAVTVTFSGNATAAGTITLKNGTTVLATVAVAAGATSATATFVMPAANVTLTATFA